MDSEKNTNQQERHISDWDRMIAGKLYNSASKDIEKSLNCTVITPLSFLAFIFIFLCALKYILPSVL